MVRTFAPGAAARLIAALFSAYGQAAVEPNPHGRWEGLRRGQRSINYRSRAARSHAGKPAGYVKAY